MRDHGELEQHLLNDEGEAEGGHGEVEAAQAKTGQPEQVADDGRDSGRRQHTGHEGPLERFGEHGGRVGPDREEGGVPERDLAGIADQEIQAERHQHVDEETGHDVEDVVVGEARQREQCRHHRDEEQRTEPCGLSGSRGHQTFLIGTAPNRPLGRKTRTAMSRM